MDTMSAHTLIEAYILIHTETDSQSRRYAQKTHRDLEKKNVFPQECDSGSQKCLCFLLWKTIKYYSFQSTFNLR